jgi:hypothetical protein
MAKFEIEFELQGLKLKVKGEREDIPQIAQNLGQQVAGLFQPMADIVDGQVPRKQVEATVQGAEPNGRAKVGRPRRSRPPSQTDGSSEPKVIEWAHDPNKWGTPKQQWKGWQKILWLLYVVDQEKGLKELSGPQIADTFNTHFRQAGLLNKNSMPRDLGALKQRTPSFVGDRATQSPITWFLTEMGVKEAEKLVADAKGLTLQQPRLIPDGE